MNNVRGHIYIYMTSYVVLTEKYVTLILGLYVIPICFLIEKEKE